MNKQTILKAYNGDTIAKTQTYNHYRKVLKSMLYGYNFDLDPSICSEDVAQVALPEAMKRFFKNLDTNQIDKFDSFAKSNINFAIKHFIQSQKSKNNGRRLFFSMDAPKKSSSVEKSGDFFYHEDIKNERWSMEEKLVYGDTKDEMLKLISKAQVKSQGFKSLNPKFTEIAKEVISGNSCRTNLAKDYDLSISSITRFITEIMYPCCLMAIDKHTTYKRMGQHLNKSAKGLIVQEKGTEFAKKVGYI